MLVDVSRAHDINKRSWLINIGGECKRYVSDSLFYSTYKLFAFTPQNVPMKTFLDFHNIPILVTISSLVHIFSAYQSAYVNDMGNVTM